MNETAKRILKTAGIILLAVILILVIYLLYLVISYHRIEDNLALQVETSDEGGQQETKNLTTGEQYSALTYNIGFGAYTPDFSFFMDGGKSSWAKSKDSVLDTVQGAGDLAASLNPDFAMIEEIDLDSTRSYHVNEYDILRNCFPNDYYVFAQNYDSAFLFYPFTAAWKQQIRHRIVFKVSGDIRFEKKLADIDILQQILRSGQMLQHFKGAGRQWQGTCYFCLTYVSIRQQ